MPFKSEAQRRKFHAMLSAGEISAKTVAEWEHATPKGEKLPEHVKKSEYAKGVHRALETFNVQQGEPR